MPASPMNPSPSMPPLKIGLFAIGLDAYWPQFPGLEERLKGYTERVAQKLGRPGAQVVNLGLVDFPEKASDADHAFRRADVDLNLLIPQHLCALLYRTASRAACPGSAHHPKPGAFSRVGLRSLPSTWRPHQNDGGVVGILLDLSRAGDRECFQPMPYSFLSSHRRAGERPYGLDEIDDWIEAARVAGIMEHNRLGVMGHYYGGMLDIYSDLTQQCAYFGGHMEMVEVDELVGLRRQVSDSEIQKKVLESFKSSLKYSQIAEPMNSHALRAPPLHSTGWSKSTISARLHTTPRDRATRRVKRP
jgi:L-arabinose isomerase